MNNLLYYTERIISANFTSFLRDLSLMKILGILHLKLVSRLAVILFLFLSFSGNLHSQALKSPTFFQFADPAKKYTFHSVQNIPHRDWQMVNSANFGKRGGYGWVKFFYTSTSDQTIWLEVPSHFIDSLALQLLVVDSSGSTVLAEVHGFENQPVKHRYFLYPLRLKTGKKYDVYLRGYVPVPDVLKIPIVLWEPSEFLEHNRTDNWGWAFFAGVMMMAVMLSLISFGIQPKNLTYLYFAGYVCFINLYALLNDGWGVFLPRVLKPLDANILLGHWINIGIGFFILFSRKFLGINSRGSWYLKRNPLWITLVIELAILIAHLGELTKNTVLFQAGYQLGMLLSFLYLICWFLYLSDAIKRSFKPVWLHIASVVIFISFLLINVIFVNTGLIKTTISDMLIFRLAVIIDLIVILISWVYRQKVVEQHKLSLELENQAHQKTITEAIQRQQAEEIKALSLKNEIQQQRVSLARDLHDGIGSELTHIIHRLDILAYKSNQQQPLLSLGDFTRATNQNLRDTLWILNQQNITSRQWYERTLSWLSKMWEDREVPQLHTEFDYDSQCIFGPTLANAIFRITQEAVNNSLKYADARNIGFSLTFCDNRLILILNDDGKGFNHDTELSGYGLSGIRCRTEELGGVLHIESNSGGTTIKIELPIH